MGAVKATDLAEGTAPEELCRCLRLQQILFRGNSCSLEHIGAANPELIRLKAMECPYLPEGYELIWITHSGLSSMHICGGSHRNRDMKDEVVYRIFRMAKVRAVKALRTFGDDRCPSYTARSKQRPLPAALHARGQQRLVNKRHDAHG